MGNVYILMVSYITPRGVTVVPKTITIKLVLPPEVAEAVLAEARRRGLRPTQLVRMWIYEKVGVLEHELQATT